MAAFRIRMFRTAGRNRSNTSTRIVKSGIVAAAGFPPQQSVKLILECAKRYNPERRAIFTIDGKMLANLTAEVIGETSEFQPLVL